MTRAGDYALALDVLAGPAVRETPLGRLLRADLLLALGRTETALAAAESITREHGDTGQGLLCAGHARLALGDRPGAAEAFARAAAADPGRIAARVNAAALALPWVEGLFGAFLIAGFRVRAASLATTIMMSVFLAAIASAWARGIDITCGCFGTGAGDVPISWHEIVRDSLFLLLSLWVFTKPLPRRPRPVPRIG